MQIGDLPLLENPSKINDPMDHYCINVYRGILNQVSISFQISNTKITLIYYAVIYEPNQ